MPSLVEIGPMVLEKKMKMLKVFDNDDNRQNLTRKAKKLSMRFHLYLYFLYPLKENYVIYTTKGRDRFH